MTKNRRLLTPLFNFAMNNSTGFTTSNETVVQEGQLSREERVKKIIHAFKRVGNVGTRSF